MGQPNRYQPITHDQIVERLTRTVQRWREMHDEADRLADAEQERREHRIHVPEHQFGD